MRISDPPARQNKLSTNRSISLKPRNNTWKISCLNTQGFASGKCASARKSDGVSSQSNGSRTKHCCPPLTFVTASLHCVAANNIERVPSSKVNKSGKTVTGNKLQEYGLP
jgi:hypothetical protein